MSPVGKRISTLAAVIVVGVVLWWTLGEGRSDESSHEYFCLHGTGIRSNGHPSGTDGWEVDVIVWAQDPSDDASAAVPWRR